MLLQKFEGALRGHLPQQCVQRILEVCASAERFDAMPVHCFMDLFAL